MDNLYFYDTNLGIIGIKDNNKAITEIQQWFIPYTL